MLACSPSIEFHKNSFVFVVFIAAVIPKKTKPSWLVELKAKSLFTLSSNKAPILPNNIDKIDSIAIISCKKKIVLFCNWNTKKKIWIVFIKKINFKIRIKIANNLILIEL